MGHELGGWQGRILLVEADDLLRWSMRNCLEQQGYQVVEARDGRSARAHLSPEPPDLVVTELHLQDTNGLDLADEIRAIRPESLVIVVTSNGSKETVLTALRRGIFDFIEKPFALELLCIVAAKAMDKIRMARDLVRLSRTDGLTGLFNQRYFYEVLGREINRARRQGRRLSLILVDLDNFKELNDRLGHLAGDEILVKVAGCLNEACRRDMDLAFRYGGDEFMMILPEADLDTARRVAGRVRGLVAAQGFAGLTVSVGLAELSEEQEFTAFIRHADEAMYLAKQMGGDRAVAFAERG